MQASTYVQLSSLQPDILALRAELAALGDELPRGDHLVSVNLESGSGDPSWSMFGVGLDDGVKKSSSSFDDTRINVSERAISESPASTDYRDELDLPNLSIGLDDHRVEIGKVAFRVDCRRGSRGDSSLRSLQDEVRDLVSLKPHRCGGNEMKLEPYLVQLERENFVSSVTDLDQIRHRARVRRRVSSVLHYKTDGV
jgi:hypothetical protein